MQEQTTDHIMTYSIKFSVAVVTYNHENCLERALDSIFAQKHNYSFEILVYDDCSTDGTPNIIRRYQDKYPNIIKPTLQQKNIGAPKNFIQCLRACRGEYIAILDGDDYWTIPDKILQQISFLDNHPDYVLSCHRYKRFLESNNELADDPYENFFKNKPEGFEITPDIYYKQWFTQPLTVVLRNSAIQNSPKFEQYRYCWDNEIMWSVLTHGKGYIHSFYGGIYYIHAGGIWSGADTLKQATTTYLTLDEFLRHHPNDFHLRNFFYIYRNYSLIPLTQKDIFLDINHINHKNFTIISDDGWGGEVYKALNIIPTSPFIGINIYNKDFLLLASDPKKYVYEPLQFIEVKDSKHVQNFNHSHGKAYPIARLGKDIELHFTAYPSEIKAEKEWHERVPRINWDNLFLKIDVSQEDMIPESISRFKELPDIYKNKACFLGALRKRDAPPSTLEDTVSLIECWNPEAEILFPISLQSFDLVGWLNGIRELPKLNRSVAQNFYIHDKKLYQKPRQHFDIHYFIWFNEENYHKLDALFFPKSYRIYFDQESEYLTLDYHKSNDDHFHLSLNDKSDAPGKEYIESVVDLRNPKNRHVFVLCKGTANHLLKVDLVVPQKETDTATTIRVGVNGLEQNIPSDFEWLHFDFSMIDDGELESVLSYVKGVCFCVAPGMEANGRLEILSIFLGSPAKFKEILNHA